MNRLPDQVQIELQLIKNARELGPRLAERAYQADQDMRIPDETIAEMKAAGLFKILQPARWGGFEMDPRTFYKVQTVLAEYCMSTAWIYGVMGVHPWQIARYPMKTQEEIWGEDVNTLVASTYMPTAKVTPVEGGYQVSGRWGFSSCCEHSSWFLLGGIVPEADGRPPEHGTFLIPRSEVTIHKNWDTLGIRGSGSHDVEVKGCFVPAHRVQRTNSTKVDDTPGRRANTNPIYNLSFASVFVRAVSTACIGGLRGAINEFTRYASQHVGNHGSKTAEDPQAQQAIVEAMCAVDAMELVLERDYSEMMDYAERGELPPVERRLLYRYHSSSVPSACADHVSTLMRCMGAQGMYSKSPIGRIFRDIHQARGHIANNYMAHARVAGAVFLGLPNPDPFV